MFSNLLADPKALKVLLNKHLLLPNMSPAKATFIEEVEVIRSELEESEVTVEGENISKDDMLNEWGWSEFLVFK